MQRHLADIHLFEGQILGRTLRWASVAASGLSALWVPLLIGLVYRCKLTVHPFPVLGKFSPFSFHFQLINSLLHAAPFFALLAAGLLAGAWYTSKSNEANRTAAVLFATSIAVSVLMVAGNPANYFSWFMS